MAERALAPVESNEPARERLLRNLIMKDATNDQIDLALNICRRYGFDPLLKHIVFISGALYVTRDGLIHLAHSSGQFDGIEVSAERDDSGKWTAIARVYRRDMTRPFAYSAYQPEHENTRSIAWQKAPRAMTIKCAEVMALRRAFDVSLGGAEEVGLDESDIPGAEVVNVTERNERVTLTKQEAASWRVETIKAGYDANDINAWLKHHDFAGLGALTERDAQLMHRHAMNKVRPWIAPQEPEPPFTDEPAELPFTDEEYAEMAKLDPEHQAEMARR